MNFFVIILLWQHICTLFLVQGGKSWLASLHEKQRTQIQDMLPHQYYNEKVHILTRDFSLELYVLPDDDKRYAIEICKSSEKCFKKVI